MHFESTTRCNSVDADDDDDDGRRTTANRNALKPHSLARRAVKHGDVPQEPEILHSTQLLNSRFGLILIEKGNLEKMSVYWFGASVCARRPGN